MLYRRGWTLQRIIPSLLLVGLGLVALPHRAEAWWNADWTYRKQITIDAGPKGAGLTADAGQIPVLIRLHDGDFKFTEAKDDGTDLRFIAGDDKTPLKFHIESYDSVLDIALIWVAVPAVAPGAPINIFMYFGNDKATAASDPHGTYDASTALVYHFAERNAPPHDETANGNDAKTAVATTNDGAIGAAAHFDGSSAVVIPASPSLTIAQGGGFSWSAWVKPGAPLAGQVLFAKHDDPRSLVIGLDENVPYISVNDGTATQRTPATDALPAASWHQLSVTASDHITLYVDGQPKVTLAATLPALAGTASLGGDVSAAAAAPAVAAPGAPPAAPGATTAPAAPATPAAPALVPGTGYIGDLDELEIDKVARSPGFVAAMFANEASSDKLVSYGQDEEHAGWFSGGTVGVILGSVTADGWVVIGMLVVMALLSWVVMASKTLTLRRIGIANEEFLVLFRRAAGDFEKLEREVEAGDDDFSDSSIFRIFEMGMGELRRRFAANADPTVPRCLATQSVAAIRAALDQVATREGQRLNAGIVLLTIAISGGPFLGLLGTVVGVMITFAAIAAAGDVNINAIAPGMAAALAATVSGLGVAIPALFGYNYLVTRIRDLTADMHVFVDEYATRVAETYRMGGDAQNLAAE